MLEIDQIIIANKMAQNVVYLFCHTESDSHRKYPISTCHRRDGLSGDMLAMGLCHLVNELV